ncbi:unnamed protein product [Effrenium voratum]|nr:unnamed protein product [Effrenium voratum]
MRVNARPTKAAMETILDPLNLDPCMLRAGAPKPAAAGLSGDILRAHDAYNEQQAAGPKAAALSARGSTSGSKVNRAEKKALSEMTFNTPKEKAARYSSGLIRTVDLLLRRRTSGAEVKKELKDVAGILMDMPQCAEELAGALRDSQGQLTALNAQLPGGFLLSGLATFEELTPICADIAVAVDKLRLIKGQSKGLLAELKKRLAGAATAGDATITVTSELGDIYSSPVLSGYNSRSLREGEFHRRVAGAGFALNVRPVWVDCPICTEEDEVDISQLPVLLPSAVASALLTSKLLQQVIVDRSHLRLYWQHMLLDYPRHELCDQPEENLERAIPIVLWGDEGTSNRMVDVSLLRHNSKASRNIVFACPTNAYMIHQKVNQTLQALLRAVQQDFVALAQGLQVENEVFTLHVVAVKGDLKYLAQAMNFSRFPGCEEVCFRCTASMGRKDISTVYTDISPQAGWREGPAAPPYFELPPLSEMPNFTLRMVSADFMHTWNLGVARDLIGSCLKICLKTQFWPGPNLSQRLKQLQRDINLFKKQRGLQMHLQQIKPSRLGWAGADVCPEYKSSASDAAVMVRFLAYKLSLKAAPPPYEGLSACLYSANMLQEAVTRGSCFLNPAEVEKISLCGNAFLSSYLQLAHLASSRRDYYFKLRPKFHILQHIISDAADRPSHRNPGWDSCWLDEDWVKTNLRMLRRMSPRTCCENLLQRHMLLVKQELSKHLASCV